MNLTNEQRAVYKAVRANFTHAALKMVLLACVVIAALMLRAT